MAGSEPWDLKEMDMEKEIYNSTVLAELEQKLPHLIMRDWVIHVTSEAHCKKTPEDRFEEFLKFVKVTKERVEYTMSDTRTGAGKSLTMLSFVSANDTVKQQKEIPRERNLLPCLACKVDVKNPNDPSLLHPMGRCEVWKNLSLKEREKLVKCKRCPYKTDHKTEEVTAADRRRI